MAAQIVEALDAHHAGSRVPWVQRCARTGDIVGTTSYYAPDPHNRSVAIGYTSIGRKWWRTGINTEAKLLLLTRAFDELGAERVEWHTDIRNERSQAAIARLGANREAVLRHHRLRPDGTWRDTVQYSMIADEWPTARKACAPGSARRWGTSDHGRHARHHRPPHLPAGHDRDRAAAGPQLDVRAEHGGALRRAPGLPGRGRGVPR
ncbi:GNAT family N-acetyltransferase [Luedemannella flava]